MSHPSLCILFIFFFKQKTAYEMRISDWSSDVCSSDLLIQASVSNTADKFSSEDLGGLTKEARNHRKVWQQLVNEDDATVSTLEGAVAQAVARVSSTAARLNTLSHEHDVNASQLDQSPPRRDLAPDDLLQSIRQEI